MIGSSIAFSHRSSARWGALALVVAAQFMVVLDMSIVNVALATIKDDLRFSEASLQWVVSAYAITFGGFLLLGGRLADLLGRRRVFVAGIAVFTISSALAGLAWSSASLVAFRGLQGIGGALFAPAGLSLLMTIFREGRERNLALGIWGAASGSGAAVGVLLGGVLTSYLSWPWIFYLNVPVGLALVVLAPRRLPESRGDGERHFDVAGATSVTASLMLLVYGLTRATQNGWGSDSTIALLGVSALLAAAFVLVERRAAHPLMPFQVFRGNTLAVGTLITCVISGIAFSQFFLLTLYLQQVLHYSAARAGLAFAAIAVTVAFTSNVAQGLVTRFGPRRVLAVGLLSAAASQALLVRLPVHAHYVTDLLPSFILSGVGIGVSFVAVTIAALAGVEPAQSGIASGLVNTSRQVGGAVGLAAMTTIAAAATGHASFITAAATTHGYRVAFAVLATLGLVSALATPALRVHRPRPVTERREERFELAEEAA
jgi:EmrB/QacA subfamily drug resistance transporter